MSTLNLQINSIAFKDIKPSNNPSIRTFDLSYKLLGINIEKPKSEDFFIAPGETKTIFDGTRTTQIDGTTAFTVTRPDPSANTYRFSHVGGTAPVFRTDRIPGIDNTTQFTVTVNGPVATYTQSGGTALDTSNVQIGDILKIENGAGFSSSNAGRFTIIAKTVNSVSVSNVDAIPETITITNSGKFFIYSNGSNNQIQLKDKVIISAGFSQASHGTFEIIEVTPSFFDILVASPDGIPLESSIIPGVSGLTFYSSSKKFVLIAAQQKCSVRNNNETSDSSLLEPAEVNNPERPAIYVKQGTTFSLIIKNLSLETLSVLVASAE